MESSELNTPPPPPKNDHHAGKSTPPRDTLTSSASSKSHHRRLRSGSGGGDDDDCSSVSSAASSPSYRSRKPPKPEATQPPPNQEMERSTSGYRIPPSVFERNKSSSPADWSVASNESLFSIHVGNMSFTNDSYMWRSGELGPPTAAAAAVVSPPPPEQMFCYSTHSSTGGAADMRSRELGIAEATMLEVIKENEGRSQPLTSEARQARRSAGSNQSNMSFAFSTAGGDTERMASSVKSSLPASQVQQMDSSEPQPDVQSPVAKEKGAQPRTKWLFCCPCFSFCP